MTRIKEQLYQLCYEYLRSKEADLKKIIADAREASGNETKSSAGDKYETAREVLQQEINLNLGRLNELNKLRATLEHIIPSQEADVVLPGAVVVTNNGNFYIAISAGRLEVDGTKYFAISVASPIGAKLIGQTAGYSFELNGKKILIEKVH